MSKESVANSANPELVPGYAVTLDELKRHVHAARFQAQRKANTELILLWWRIGRTILDRQQQEAWGSGVLERLAKDLRAEFPSMKGFSRRNLLYMRAFAHAWADFELANQITCDPYALDFLAIDSDASERKLEERLVDRIVDTLRELGPGFPSR